MAPAEARLSRNLSIGQTITQSVSAPDSSSKLGGRNDEWIGKYFEEGSRLLPFADFGSVLFTNAVENTKKEALETTRSVIIKMEDGNGNALTNVSLPSSSEVHLV